MYDLDCSRAYVVTVSPVPDSADATTECTFSCVNLFDNEVLGSLKVSFYLLKHGTGCARNRIGRCRDYRCYCNKSCVKLKRVRHTRTSNASK